MSDIIPTNPMDAAIVVLRERERELDGEIQNHTRQLEIASARRDELLDLIATLSKKPRLRKPRAVTEAAPSATEAALAAPRSSIFALPPSDVGAEAVEAA
jgi:hypothetical protein